MFANMRKARLKLNPKKCVFELTRGKVIGCLVSLKGIEANPDKNSHNSNEVSAIKKRDPEVGW
jgi:hypothetical protein